MVQPVEPIPAPPPQPDLIWDEYRIIQSHADSLIETSPALTQEEAFKLAEAETDMEEEWKTMCESLTCLMLSVNPTDSWKADGFDLGWQKRRGYKFFHAKTGKDLLREILPNTDCTFKVFKNENNTLTIFNYHHDSPTGERYEIGRRDA